MKPFLFSRAHPVRARAKARAGTETDAKKPAAAATGFLLSCLF
jgi:hypothetical protein